MHRSVVYLFYTHTLTLGVCLMHLYWYKTSMTGICPAILSINLWYPTQKKYNNNSSVYNYTKLHVHVVDYYTAVPDNGPRWFVWNDASPTCP